MPFILSVLAVFNSVAVLAGGVLSSDSSSDWAIGISPASGMVESLDEITITTCGSEQFAAFVYMPSLYALNEDGTLGPEVSACLMVDDTARGKDVLRFRILSPPKVSGKYALLIKKNSFSIINGEEHLSNYKHPISQGRRLSAGSQSEFQDIPFTNYPVNLESDSLRILHITNSYGRNLLYYLDGIIESEHSDVSNVLVERLFYSGGSFKDWCYVNEDMNPEQYWYFRVTGELEINLPDWEGDIYDGSEFRMMLAENSWDLIIINQASLYAPFYEKWESEEAGGYLPALLNVIRSYQPEVPIGMLLIHSYAQDYEGNTQHWNSTERWEKIRDGVEWLNEEYNIDFVVPYGTAIQNLRLTKYNNVYELTGDGSHLATGLPLYAAACCYFERVFSSRYKKTIYGNSFRVHEPIAQFSDKYEDCLIPVDDASAEIAQKAAFLACQNMYEARNPELACLTDYKYGDTLNKDEYCITYELSIPEVVDGIEGSLSAGSSCVYTSSGILLKKAMTDEEWKKLPKGLYVRNGKKTIKHD